MDIYVVSERERAADFWEILSVIDDDSLINATIDKHHPNYVLLFDNVFNEFTETRTLDCGDYVVEIKIEKFKLNEI